MARSAPHRRRRKHANWPVRWILFSIFVSFLIYAILLPLLKMKSAEDISEANRWTYLSERILASSMSWFIVGWTFFFGACLGSFLNVVAWRVPNGLTLLGSSRCPYCLVTIESRYNFPILGWFWLRGRCGACRLPISPRYFLVEIAAGLLMVWLLIFELMTNGSNLPGKHSFEIHELAKRLAAGDFMNLQTLDWSLVRIVVAHAAVGYTLLTLGLMKLDRLRTPVVWASIHLVGLLLFVIYFWRDFLFTSWYAPLREAATTSSSFQSSTLIVGSLVGGLAVGLILQRITRTKETGALLGVLLISIAIGFPATLMTCIGLIGIGHLCLLLGKRDPFERAIVLFMLMTFLIQIAVWKPIASSALLPGGVHWWVDLIWLLGFGALVGSYRFFRSRSEPEQRNESGDVGSADSN